MTYAVTQETLHKFMFDEKYTSGMNQDPVETYKNWNVDPMAVALAMKMAGRKAINTIKKESVGSIPSPLLVEEIIETVAIMMFETGYRARLEVEKYEQVG